MELDRMELIEGTLKNKLYYGQFNKENVLIHNLDDIRFYNKNVLTVKSLTQQERKNVLNILSTSSKCDDFIIEDDCIKIFNKPRFKSILKYKKFSINENIDNINFQKIALEPDNSIIENCQFSDMYLIDSFGTNYTNCSFNNCKFIGFYQRNNFDRSYFSNCTFSITDNDNPRYGEGNVVTSCKFKSNNFESIHFYELTLKNTGISKDKNIFGNVYSVTKKDGKIIILEN